MVPAPDVNYFTCTLGEAAEINSKIPHSYTTITSFLDVQARDVPERSAVALPCPGADGDGEWQCEVICEFLFLSSGYDIILRFNIELRILVHY